MTLTYEEWLAECEEELTIEFAESGRDRELDFDQDLELERRYERYLINQALQ